MKSWVEAAAARIDMAKTVGISRVASRAGRRLRYATLYPRFGGLMLRPSSEPFGAEAKLFEHVLCEEAAARASSRCELDRVAGELARGELVLLNLPPVDLLEAVAGMADRTESDALFDYTVHYGEWALALAHRALLEHGACYRDALIRAIGAWIEHNPLGSQPGWDPYPISRRLVAWARVHRALTKDRVWSRFFAERLAPSLHLQARVLAANLERDLANNHLLSNFRALAWIGMSFPSWPSADRFAQLGLAGLFEETRRQVLADGGHDERSFSYHTIVLADLLETRQLARVVGRAVPEDFDDRLRRMFDFLAGTIAPDGTWPMLNDTVPGHPMDPRALLLAGAAVFGDDRWAALGADGDPAYAEWLSPGSATTSSKLRGELESARTVVFPETGLAVLRDGRGNWVTFDAGPMGSEHMQGHGHADALSFVLWANNRPALIDPGVCTYSAGACRDWLRGTSAHNTATVDGRDQCVLWGSFRVAFAPKVRLLEHTERSVTGEHDGYTRAAWPIIHRRRLSWRAPRILEIDDLFDGMGKHTFELSLQMQPGAITRANASGATVNLDGTELSIQCAAPGEAVISLELSPVSLGWNQVVNAPRLRVRFTAEAPARSSFLIEVR